MKNPNTTARSKFLSLVLRHSPETIGLKLDEAGWAQTDELLASAEFNRAIGKDKVLRDLAKSIGAENTARKQVLEKRQQAVVNALKQMRTDL